ncbi:hypothetical protein AOXY_G9475 [Acipenser oxyrinchus oxyrinchus]|uniref:Uncharacterized protein n=1 Tax=Acipenser oxyrinchus oxyrinchus TaxID=40147 RepID=A0AAD8DHC9_ACIOX|nr:hypothetical protein AOXY_G9475 [Acipenser oxyrinchus oxyrinchus]
MELPADCYSIQVRKESSRQHHQKVAVCSMYPHLDIQAHSILLKQNYLDGKNQTRAEVKEKHHSVNN